MKTYRLDPLKFSKQIRNIFLLYGISGAVMVIIILWLNKGKATFSSMVWLIPIVLVLFGYSAYRAYKQRKQFWEGFLIQMDDEKLIQTQPRYPDLTIKHDEIISAVEGKFGLVISTHKYCNLLAISKDLPDADYAEIKAILTSWAPGTEEMV